MKCQFCHKRCTYVVKDQSYYSHTKIEWVCRNHPLEVTQIVRNEKVKMRREFDITGYRRHWEMTYLLWNVSGQEYRANYNYDTDDTPLDFTVEIKRIDNDRGIGLPTPTFSWYEEIFSLRQHPKDITPENIVSKIKTYLVFS